MGHFAFNAEKLVFLDVDAAVLAREDAVQSTSVWTAFLARILPHGTEVLMGGTEVPMDGLPLPRLLA